MTSRWYVRKYVRIVDQGGDQGVGLFQDGSSTYMIPASATAHACPIKTLGWPQEIPGHHL